MELIGINGDGGEETDTIQPGIVPTAWYVQQATLGDGTICTVLNLVTPTGMHITFWPGDGAAVLGKELQRAGRATAAGFLLPSQRTDGPT